VAHQLLIVLAAFIAIGLDPAVAFLVRRGLPRHAVRGDHTARAGSGGRGP